MKVFVTCVVSVLLNLLFVLAVGRYMPTDWRQDLVLIAWASVGIPLITGLAFAIVNAIMEHPRSLWGVRQKNRQIPAGVV